MGIFVFHLGFVNRGFLFGPYCPVYGFGSLLFIFLLNKQKEKPLFVKKINIRPVIVFLEIVLITTGIELLTSYLMELTIGKWLWDYNGYFLNFQGRIALSTSLRFGLGGMIILYVLHPFLEKIKTKKYISPISIALLFIFTVDIIKTVSTYI